LLKLPDRRNHKERAQPLEVYLPSTHSVETHIL
jgi:hypothetical protein